MKSVRVILVGVLLAGCQPTRPADQRDPGGPLSPTESPAESRVAFDAPGIRLQFDSNYERIETDGYVLQLKVPGTPAGILSLDIPKLPPHVPGLIPIGLVVNGYVDDVKKQRPTAEILPTSAEKVAGANARRVRATWSDDAGITQVQEAVLIVHGDRVFIFRANATADQADAVRAALDQVLSTVEWR